MRVRKQKDSTEEREIEERGGLAEKRFRNPKHRKEKANRENIPQRMHQTVNG